ncbi:MAG: substrate-binding domain-containing protein [Pseudomonadota bacterium]
MKKSLSALVSAGALSVSFMPPMASAEIRTLQVVGTGDGMELVRLVGAAYTNENPDRPVVVPPSIGSGGGIAAVGAGKAYLARVARPLKPAEKETGLVSKGLFRLPTAIYVHPELDVEGLTTDQLAGIYEGTITNWAEVGGPDMRIKVVRREDTDSSLAVLRGSMPGWKDLTFTTRSKIAVTTQDAVQTVQSVKGAIGFGPFSRPLEESVRVMSIDGRYPTDKAYPSAVTISLVWRVGAMPDHASAFLNYGLSPKSQALLKAHGALPVSR